MSRILCIVIGGGEGTVTWGIFGGMFPWGCEDTVVARNRLLCRGGGYAFFRNRPTPSSIYRPAFARPTGNEIYVLLLEKALAKMLGSYAALVGGWTWLGYTYLFGCTQHEKFAFNDDGSITKWVVTADCINRSSPTARPAGEVDPAEAWEYLEDSATNHWTLCSAAWKGAGLETIAEDTGLVAGHAYTVTKAVTTSSGHQLLQCRNPWGAKEWGRECPESCPWSDNSPLWAEHPDVAEEVGFEGPSEDGLFWIPWDLFQAYGRALCISWIPAEQQPE